MSDNEPTSPAKAVSMTEAAGANRKRRRLMLAAKIIGALVVLFIGALLYVQTRHAFRHVIMPIVARRAPGEIKVAEGSVSITGKVTLRDVTFEDPAMGIAFGADSIEVAAAPLSFIMGDLPRVRAVTIKNPSVVIETDAEEPKPEDAEAEAREQETTESPNEDSPVSAQGPLVPIAIDSAEIVGLSLRIVQAGETTLELEDAKLTLVGLAPGSAASVSLASDFAIAPQAADRARSGSVEFELELAQAARERDLSWSGELVASVREGLEGSARAESARLDFTANYEGNTSPGREFETKLALEAKQGGESVGKIDGQVAWAAKADGVENKIDARVELASITREFINPALAALGTAQFESGVTDGLIEIRSDAGGVNFESSLTARNWRIRPTPEEEPTPPVDYTSAAKGRWDRTGEQVTFELAELEILEAGRPWVSIALDESATIRLAEPTEGGGSRSEAAHLDVRLSDLGVEQVRPWMTLTGSDPLEMIESGSVSAQLKLGVIDDGRRLELSGSLHAEGLSIRHGEETESIGPLRIQNDIELSIEELDHVVLNPWSARVWLDDQLVAEARATGAYGIAEGSVDLRLEFDSKDSAGALESFGLLAPDQDPRPLGGALESETRLARANDEAPIEVTTDLSLRDFELVMAEGNRIARTIAIKADVAIDAVFAEATLNDVTVALLDPGGAVAGTIGAKGFWPLAIDPQGRGGRATVTLRDFDGVPWLRFADALAGTELSEAPIEADLIVTVDAAGEVFGFEGEERIGPVLLGSGDIAPEEVTMTIRNEFEKIGDQVRGIIVEATGRRDGRTDDHLRIEGSALLGERPKIELTGRVDSLAAELYTAPFIGEPEEIAEADAEPEPEETEANEEPEEPTPVTGLPIDLDVALRVGRFTWRDILVEDGEIKLTGEGGALHADIDPTRLNGGTLEGDFDYEIAAGVPRIGWRAEGKGIDVGPVVASIRGQAEGGLAGRATFSSKGTGQGSGAELSRTLEGDLLFDLTDGNLGRSKLLAFIAEHTGVSAFDQMLFDTFHGDVKLGGGRVGVNRLDVAGNLTRLVTKGTLTLEGELLDFGVQPGVGSKVGGLIPERKFATSLLRVADGFTELPIMITVRGSVDTPAYGVRIVAPSLVRDLGASTLALAGATLDGAVGVASEGIKDPKALGAKAIDLGGGAVKKTVEGAVDGSTGVLKKAGGAAGGLLKKSLEGLKLKTKKKD